jgi:hypothetical protein
MVESSSDMSSQRKKHSWLSPIGRAIEVASSSFKSLRRGCGRRDPHLHRAVAFFIFFEPLRSSSSRRRDFHLLRAIALIFIAPSLFSSFSSHCAHLHRAVAIFIFFEPSH